MTPGRSLPAKAMPRSMAPEARRRASPRCASSAGAADAPPAPAHRLRRARPRHSAAVIDADASGQRPLARVHQQQHAVDHTSARAPTSPPKSAWPGVSTMFSFTPRVADGRVLGEDRDPLLALECPSSRGTRSATSWFARKAPDCQSRGVHQRCLPMIDARRSRHCGCLRGGPRQARVVSQISSPLPARVTPDTA